MACLLQKTPSFLSLALTAPRALSAVCATGCQTTQAPKVPLPFCPWQDKGLGRACRTSRRVRVSGQMWIPQASGLARDQPHRDIQSSVLQERLNRHGDQSERACVCVRARAHVCVRTCTRTHAASHTETYRAPRPAGKTKQAWQLVCVCVCVWCSAVKD